MNITVKPIGGVPESEYSIIFLEGMVNRMAMSFFKYGLVVDAYPHKVNAIDSLRLRLQKYLDTGNTEFLMDVANFAMIEFMHPKIAGAIFKATDSDQSPGRTWNTGAVNTQRNNHESEEVRSRFYNREGD